MLEFDFKVSVGAFDLTACGRQVTPRMGLFGPSGGGKTTLLNCLAGLVRPQSGHITMDGQVLFDAAANRHVPAHRRAIGYVFQDGRLFGHMSVRANIEYGRQRRTRAPSLSELRDVLDLDDFLERRPDTLSGGEKQRVVLARALAAGPRLLLLDEPLASLDEASRLRILPYLARIYEAWHVPFVYVSHSLTEIIAMAEMSWQMSAGRIARTARSRELLTDSSQGLEPVLNILSGTVGEIPDHTGYAVVACGGVQLRVPDDGLHVGDAVTVALPARDLMLSLSSPEGLSARNIVPATIRELEQNGHALWVTVEAGENELIVELTEEAGRELGLRLGMPVYVVVKSHSVRVTTAQQETSCKANPS